MFTLPEIVFDPGSYLIIKTTMALYRVYMERFLGEDFEQGALTSSFRGGASNQYVTAVIQCCADDDGPRAINSPQSNTQASDKSKLLYYSRYFGAREAITW